MDDDRGAAELRKLLAADLDAGFVALVRAYQAALFTVALRLCAPVVADAEDLVAESLLCAYRSLREFPPERIESLKPRAWLVTIVLNTGRNARRAAARRPATSPLGSLGDRVEGTPDAAGDHDGNEAMRRLLAQLPSNQRTAVVLRHVVGLSTAEVAEALGCPEGTAKSHVSRGMSRLRGVHAIQEDRQ